MKVESVEEFLLRNGKINKVESASQGKSRTSRYHSHEGKNFNGASLSKHKLRSSTDKSKGMYVNFMNRFGSGTSNWNEVKG